LDSSVSRKLRSLDMKRSFATVAAVLAMVCSGVSARAQALAAPPQLPSSMPPTLIRISGQVATPAGAIANPPTAQLTFALYDAADASTPLWVEQQLVALDAAGRYAAFVGATLPDGIPLDFVASGAARWLGVQVNGEPEQPRTMLVSVPYALRAQEAETLAGKSASDFVLNDNLTDTVKSTLKSQGVSTRDPANPLVSTIGKIPKFSDTVNNTVDSILFESGGNIGVNNLSPVNPLSVTGGATAIGNFYRLTNPNITIGQTVDPNVPGNKRLQLYNDTTNNVFDFDFFVQAGSGLPISLNGLTGGNVGIGTTTPGAKLDVNGSANVSGNVNVSGNINVTGNINAKYQDVAEWVEMSEPLEPGTVVSVDPQEPNRVVASPRAYDTRVAGAVSRQPGLVLGDRSDTKAMVAQSGRVRIKVDASYGAIKIGDLLVTSPTPGYAMRSRPVKVGGRYLHRPGTLLGKALEALPNGKGEILVLLTLQ
jgi:hypothetical protein